MKGCEARGGCLIDAVGRRADDRYNGDLHSIITGSNQTSSAQRRNFDDEGENNRDRIMQRLNQQDENRLRQAEGGSGGSGRKRFDPLLNGCQRYHSPKHVTYLSSEWSHQKTNQV
jgi:hypothetical protein